MDTCSLQDDTADVGGRSRQARSGGRRSTIIRMEVYEEVERQLKVAQQRLKAVNKENRSLRNDLTELKREFFRLKAKQRRTRLQLEREREEHHNANTLLICLRERDILEGRRAGAHSNHRFRTSCSSLSDTTSDDSDEDGTQLPERDAPIHEEEQDPQQDGEAPPDTHAHDDAHSEPNASAHQDSLDDQERSVVGVGTRRSVPQRAIRRRRRTSWQAL